MKVSSDQYFYIVWILSLGFLKSSCLECHIYNLTECGASAEECAKSRKTETCKLESNTSTTACYALWKRPHNSTRDILQYKGCNLNNNHCGGLSSCVERNYGKQYDPNSLTFYCCCSEDYCNDVYEWIPDSTTTTVKPKIVHPNRSSSSILVFTLVPVFCVVVISVMYFLRRKILTKPLTTSVSQIDEEKILLDKSESSQTLSITLVEVKASGRYGKVWKASMAGSNSYVAVKILPLREKASWKLEQDIYSLPLMIESEWIVRFICAKTHQPSDVDNLQLWLVSEYLEHGSLYDYLKGNTLKWTELLKIAITMCNGLAFLHEETDGGSRGYKPAVAHRDFKSKNVLLRPDLTACVTDFGLAHIFYPNKPVGTCHGQVGTRRYMAPEVLEGAVSFTRDNFQRIDMYACGLVLWELASRCGAQQGPIGDYRLPFEEFVGQQPSLEEMQDVVVTQRKRPTIQNDWMSHPGMAVLAEAMKDAWDQDAEARISASCIVERLKAVSNKAV
ncbi:unnamed protein product [Allacma fusca]|uniref:Protein kinase domain-containing protein n=1 Tax=Allacma fusca TaxID=39272 RepID=A0A8J2P8P7_9HEXA|nr:unnamed protein product [Allacma fusca]